MNNLSLLYCFLISVFCKKTSNKISSLQTIYFAVLFHSVVLYIPHLLLYYAVKLCSTERDVSTLMGVTDIGVKFFH